MGVCTKPYLIGEDILLSSLQKSNYQEAISAGVAEIAFLMREYGGTIEYWAEQPIQLRQTFREIAIVRQKILKIYSQ